MGKLHELEPRDYQVLREDVGLDAPRPELVLRRLKSRRPKRKPDKQRNV